jgi:hypothetical protein
MRNDSVVATVIETFVEKERSTFIERSLARLRYARFDRHSVLIAIDRSGSLERIPACAR